MWRPLPTRPLKGVGTAMVESLFSWTAMQCQTVGISPISLFKMLEPDRTSTGYSPSLLTGPGPSFIDYSASFAQICNSQDLRCGTFYVVSEIAGMHFLGRGARMLKWCPLCLSSPAKELYLPLLFMLSTASKCPKHGCDLIERCPDCGAPQRQSWDPLKWKRCRWCRANFAHTPSYTRRHRSHDFDWMNQQSIDLIELCAEPGRERVPSNVFQLFVEEFIASDYKANRDGRLSAHVQRAFVAANQKPSFNRILSMCFAHGVGIKEVFLRPKESASPGLFSEASSSASTRMPVSNYSAADRLVSVVDDLAWFAKLGYIPKPRALLAALGLPNSSLMALSDETRAKYVANSADRHCPWADSADAALRYAVKRLSRAIITNSISSCVAELSRDRRYRKILEYNAVPTFSLAAARIALHVGAISEARSGNLEPRFRHYANVITGQVDCTHENVHYGSDL